MFTGFKRPKKRQSAFWGDTKTYFASGKILPIVSNQMCATLFRTDLGTIASEWADYFDSPLSDHERRNLPRVAQYISIHEGIRVVKDEYLLWAKQTFLSSLKYALLDATAAANPDNALIQELVQDLGKDGNAEFATMSLTGLAKYLGYPLAQPGAPNYIRLLAEMPLPIYITTSYHYFLEHELENANKQPVSEIFYWNQALDRKSIFANEPEYEPSVQRPLVYHLFGSDEHSSSIVLTEDDCLTCLTELASIRTKTTGDFTSIPACIRNALSTKALLMLGYDVYSWEFRVLFRGLIQHFGQGRQSNSTLPPGICMQVDLDAEADAPRRKKRRDYLESYFATSTFNVYWGTLEECVSELYTIYSPANAPSKEQEADKNGEDKQATESGGA